MTHDPLVMKPRRIHLSERLWADVIEEAARERVTPSQWMREAAMARVLYERANPRPMKGKG